MKLFNSLCINLLIPRYTLNNHFHCRRRQNICCQSAAKLIHQSTTSPVSPAMCITDHYKSSTPGSMSHHHIMSACSPPCVCLCVQFRLSQCAAPGGKNNTVLCRVIFHDDVLCTLTVAPTILVNNWPILDLLSLIPNLHHSQKTKKIKI